MAKEEKELKKVISVLLLCLMSISFVFTGCGKKENKNVVYVYNWGDYIDESIIDEFEKETGIKVVYETFATNEEMFKKIEKAGGSYDVIMPSDYMITKMRNLDMLEKLNFDNIPNYKYIDDKYKNLAFDPNNEYSVPYMWGTVGIMYNKKVVKENVDSWDILWDPKYKKEILMIDSQRDAIAVALDKLDYSINSTDDKELEEAKQELIKQKELVLSYVGDEGKDMLIQEEGALSVVWSGDAVYMKKENPDLEYVIPKEGSNIWYDNMCIPKGSEHKENAEAFINFMNKPEIALKNVEYIGYSTPNKETFKILPEEIKNDKTAYPDAEAIKDSEVFVDLGDFIKNYDKAWTEVKAN